MSSSDDNFRSHLAILEVFKRDPKYAWYWRNWAVCEKHALTCRKTLTELLEWKKAEHDLANVLNPEAASASTPSVTGDAGDDSNMSEFLAITRKHREEREAEKERKRKLQENEIQVEYIEAASVGIHGAAQIYRPTFGELDRLRMQQMEALYGKHAEKMITMQSEADFKFNDLVSRHGAFIWPHMPFRVHVTKQ